MDLIIETDMINTITNSNAETAHIILKQLNYQTSIKYRWDKSIDQEPAVFFLIKEAALRDETLILLALSNTGIAWRAIWT